MNISEAAKISGLPAKTIRYYEEIGLIQPLRKDNGYRHFDAQALKRLHFLRRARSLDFSIEDCRALLSMQDNSNRRSADVKAVAEHHLSLIAEKISDLEKMKQSLEQLVIACHGDNSNDCVILKELAGQAVSSQNKNIQE